MKKTNSHGLFHVYACLPFVELAQEAIIRMGPVIFWPASRYKEFIQPEDQDSFHSYLDSIAQVKTKTEEKSDLINTIKLVPHGTTFISLSENIFEEQREMLLIDSLYLLYFACTFRNLYYNSEIPSFGAFRKIVPASLNFIHQKSHWENLHIEETDREDTVCIHLFDTEICEGLGQMLISIYENHQATTPDRIKDYKRSIRAIRYLVDRFFQRFVNLFDKGLYLPEFIFEPEDVIFLASSFEALFDINDRQVTSDLKQKLRPFLHLKYSKPLELFWKWVDDFYEVRRKIVHGGDNPDPIFRLNPNFEISHILIGIKLFIYSIYYQLFKYNLLESKSVDPYTPPDFKWIHPEEIILFFWTESSLLRKLSLFIARIVEERSENEELYADIHQLATLFVSMQERYFHENLLADIKFIPSALKDLELHGHLILDLLQQAKQDQTHFELLFETLPTSFKAYLIARLAEDKIKKNPIRKVS